VAVTILAVAAIVHARPVRPSVGAVPLALPSSTYTAPDPAPFGPAIEAKRGDRVAFVGDSWTDGCCADRGQALVDVLGTRLGWKVERVGVGSATDYLKSGKAGERGTYAQRLAALTPDREVRLVVVQGGLNDAVIVFKEQMALLVNEALERVVANARTAFPGAQVLVIGPMSPYVTTSPPVTEGWLPTEDSVKQYIDPKSAHPNTAGHALFADKIIEDLSELATG
jgi:hypothetical protein